MRWNDKRPISYMKWNEIYYRNRGPSELSVNGTADEHQTLVLNATNILQPEYREVTSCGVLIGSPGSNNMEFLMTDCNTKILVSGIVCISGGTEAKRSSTLTYSLRHWLVLDQQQLPWTKYAEFINVDRLDLELYKEYDVGVTRLTYEDNILQERHRSELLAQYQLPWKQDIYSCSNVRSNFPVQVDSNCKILMPSVKNFTGNLLLLSGQVRITIVSPEHVDTNMTIISVSRSDQLLIADVHCLPGWLMLGGGCWQVQEMPTSEIDITRTTHFISACDNGHPNDTSLFQVHYLFSRIQFMWDLQCTAGERCVKTNEDMSRGDPPTEYNICKTQPIKTECSPGYIVCEDGCIPDLFMCHSPKMCTENDYIHRCSHVCKAAFPTTVAYCHHHCHPNNCTCDALYFQCASGGCLNSAKLCDGHHDCQNGEDEVRCSPRSVAAFYVRPSPAISKRNDLFPDEPDASDEEVYKQLLKSHITPVNTICTVGLELPCEKGHPSCYPADKLCHYDLAADGLLRYCRNGAHLRNCSSVECSGAFKCQFSYCIPTFRVCDGQLDCPHADDESQCPLKSCRNMLQCGDVCVHTLQICDGVAQCRNNEDERMCDAPVCSHGCRCLGFSILCEDRDLSSISLLSLRKVKILTIRQRKSDYTIEKMLYPNTLLVLDISFTKLRFIPSNWFFDLGLLINLNISHNYLQYASSNSFTGLSSLSILDLSWNPVLYCKDKAFNGLSALKQLLLHHCKITVLSFSVFQHLNSLSELDISHNTIGKLNLDCLTPLSINVIHIQGNSMNSVTGNAGCVNSSHMIGDQKGLCCLAHFGKNCSGEAVSGCSSLLQHDFLVVYPYGLCFFIIVTNVLSLIFSLNSTRMEAILVSNLSVAGLIIVVPMYIISEWHLSYGREFDFYEPFICNSLIFFIGAMSSFISIQVCSSLTLLLAAYKCYGVLHTSGRMPTAVNKGTACCLLAQWLIWSTTIILSVTVWPSSLESTKCTLNLLFIINNITFPVLCGVINIVSSVITAILYSMIYKVIRQSNILTVGRKHGRHNTSSIGYRKLLIPIFLSLTSINSSSLAMLLLPFQTISSRTAATIFIGLFPLQALVNPFTYTLLTRRFSKAVRDCFLSIYRG